jgi:hypothetical protein
MLEQKKLSFQQKDLWREDASNELEAAMLSGDLAIALRQEQVESASVAYGFQQILAQENNMVQVKANIFRDRRFKEFILQERIDAFPSVIETKGLTVFFGQTTNLSSVHPGFQFPEKYAVGPEAAAADCKITASTPVLPFAFLYFEYDNNPYYWADSNPPGRDPNMMVITLLAFNCLGELLNIKNENIPLRVFAEYDLFATATCAFWDRFWPDTVGGAWSTRGTINDGHGCLTTHLSDIAVFLDGHPATELLSVESVTIKLVDQVVRQNMIVLVSVAFVILLNFILGVYSFKQDEDIKDEIRLGKKKRQEYFLDGDGITAPPQCR